MAAKFDAVSGSDAAGWLKAYRAPREGDNVTAVRALDNDGPVRPGYQDFADNLEWLYRGVVLGTRTLQRLHVRSPGGGPSAATDGALVVDRGATIGGNLGVGGNASVGGDVLGGGDGRFTGSVYGATGEFQVSAKAILLLQAGADAAGRLWVLENRLQWLRTDLSKANAERTDSTKNQLFANQVAKYIGRVALQAGVITKKVGPGDWDAAVVSPGGPDPYRLRITMVDAFADTDYQVGWCLYAGPGTLDNVTGRVVTDTLTTKGFDLSFRAAAAPLNLTTVPQFEVSFFVFGNQVS